MQHIHYSDWGRVLKIYLGFRIYFCHIPTLLIPLLTTAFRWQEQAQATDWRATLQTNQKGIHKTDKRLNAILDFLGGEHQLCKYK